MPRRFSTACFALGMAFSADCEARSVRLADVVLPMLPGESERWSLSRPEPVTLDLPGWTSTNIPQEPGLPNRRIWSFKRGACELWLKRAWDRHLVAGGPATIESLRAVAIGGRETQLYKMTVGGRDFLSAGLQGQGHDVKYFVTFEFAGCTDADLSEVFNRVTIHW